MDNIYFQKVYSDKHKAIWFYPLVHAYLRKCYLVSLIFFEENKINWDFYLQHPPQ